MNNLNQETVDFLKKLNNVSDETLDEHINIISKIKDKNARLSWKRKFDKLTEIVEKEIHPIEEKIQELFLQKQDLMDSVLELRNVMIKECIHPKEHLIHKILYVECKFCNSKLKIPAMNNFKKQEDSND